MNTGRVSDFMLERYRLEELDLVDRKTVNEALAIDKGLHSRLKSLDESDEELHRLYPMEQLLERTGSCRAGSRQTRFSEARSKPFPEKKIRKINRRFTGIAVIFIACVLLPALYLSRGIERRGAGSQDLAFDQLPDRMKGSLPTDSVLSLYLKGEEEAPFSGQELLGEGNTVQLAYNTPPGAEYYGVIYSIDGRSEVTMHYPYSRTGSSLLVSGRRTFLKESYTLDDAPAYEVFVMVISKKPLNVMEVLGEARRIAESTGLMDSKSIDEKSRMAFPGCAVETLTVLKE